MTSKQKSPIWRGRGRIPEGKVELPKIYCVLQTLRLEVCPVSPCVQLPNSLVRGTSVQQPQLFEVNRLTALLKSYLKVAPQVEG